MLRSSYNLETLAPYDVGSQPTQHFILERIKGYISDEDFRRGTIGVEEYGKQLAALEV